MSRVAPPSSVFMLLQSFHPVVGGAERQALQLSRKLVARGIAVRVLTRRLPGLAPAETLDGILIRRLPAWGRGRLGTAMFVVSSVLHLLRHARTGAVLHAHLAASHAVGAAFAGRVLGLPVFVKVGGAAGIGEIGAARQGLAGEMKLKAFSLLRPRMIAVNDDLAAELRACGLGHLETHVVPNGVDVDLYRPARPGEKARDRPGPVVLTAARLADDKGQVHALRAFLAAWASFCERHPGARFLIAGDGPEASSWQHVVIASGAPNVTLLGARADVPDLMRDADAFVLLSRGEGMSNAVLEAMASGLPILAPRVTGIVGMVEDRVHGRLFDPLDARQAEAALDWLAESPAEAGAAGARARLLAEEHSLDRAADRVVALYSSALREAA